MNQNNNSAVTTLSLAQIAAWQNTIQTESKIIAKVPSLQRGAVWNPAQVELLWDSILRGFPIGSFVICMALQNQFSRKGQNDRSNNNTQPTHHLLDGQQRANAIALGFDDPFLGTDETSPRAVLWLDLAPSFTNNSTRSFLLRVTTEAHPWGYNTSDDAKSITHAKMREAIDKYGKKRQDLSLTDTWPIDAIAPVPFAWLIRSINDDSLHSETDFWDSIIKRCKEVNKTWSNQGWVKNVCENENRIEKTKIFTGLIYANKMRVVALEVPEEVLKDSKNMVNKNQSESEAHYENVTNIEHLFQRLNSGGTVLDGEELAYSMIKAYWPEVEEPIEKLIVKRMPASRLVMLGARTALSKQNPDKLPGSLSVSAMRNLAQQKEPHIYDFFLPPQGQAPIKLVLEQVDIWLGENSADNFGLPPFLMSSLARSAPDVYLLLMWLADRYRSSPENQAGNLRKRLIGLATALHWFGENRREAVAKLYEQFNRQDDLFSDEAFKGIVGDIYKLDREKVGCHPIPTPDELDRLIVLPTDENELKKWHWWQLARNSEGQELEHYQAIQRIQIEKNLLLFAQRRHLITAYPHYDPSRQDLWEQHNRPWDYDHILPSKIIYYKQNISIGVKNWANSIANLRAWPMEDNRSDQDEAPKNKLNTADYLKDSFVDVNELYGFQKGYENITDYDHAIAFVESAKARLLRIYKEWYDTLDIGFLI